MSIAQLCPDDLLLAARQGNLNVQDEARLAAHLARCGRCQAALDVGRAFDETLGARIGDDAIASRIAGEVTARSKRRWQPYVIASVSVLFGSVAVAAVGPRVWHSMIGRFEPVAPAPSGDAVSSTSERAAPQTPVSEYGPYVEPPVASTRATDPAIEAPSTTQAAPTDSGRSSTRRKSAELSASGELESAQSLFAAANVLRARGDLLGARQLYRELQAKFPTSVEARVSLVSLGRVELNSEPGRALERFDAYLAQSQHTTLSEEALFGRASALARLGRRQQEHATWQKLLARFPSSVYAERARARLAVGDDLNSGVQAVDSPVSPTRVLPQ